MKKMLYLSLFFCVKLYSQLIGLDDLSPADSLREIGNIKGSIIEFEKVYKQDPYDRYNLYNYACALSLCNRIDESFKILNECTNILPKINTLGDPDFINLRKDKKWENFENALLDNLEKKGILILKKREYARKLLRMRAYDQQYYDIIGLTDNKICKESIVSYALWDIKRETNQKNIIELEKLIVQNGFPKKSEVGDLASEAAFLVIQHSTTEFQKKYLPEIKKLCESKEAEWESYALMYDRVQVSQNLPQKYGSQVRYNIVTGKYELLPIENEQMVEKWRKEIGMISLTEYLKYYGITFNVQK